MKRLKLQSLVHVSVLIQCIVLLSGCNKIIDWGKNNFKQAKKHSQDIVQEAQQYFCSTIAYHKFATIAEFDVLFLTDHVRMLYVDYHKKYHGVTQEQESLMRQRVLNENRYFISFYVAGTQPENLYESNRSLYTGEYQKLNDLLGDKDATWNIRLKIGDKTYLPDSVRRADLPVEYRHFFGDRYSQFKSVYLVRFEALNANGRPILPLNQKHTLSLIFSSSAYQTEVEWKNCLYSK
ncbi:MAG: hypothetical protein NTZ68_02310 [Candidatus Dependentiae bacterium]|nr:hypothetical protein [Candidatus Dependentiae bacterium]